MPGKVKKAIKKVASKVKSTARHAKNIVSNVAYSAKGETEQKGGTTTTTKERSPSQKRYAKGASSTKVTKTKAVSKGKDVSYKLTKTKTKQKAVRKYGDPVKTKTKTKTISEKRAARVIKRGAKRQLKGESTYSTLRKAKEDK